MSESHLVKITPFLTSHWQYVVGESDIVRAYLEKHSLFPELEHGVVFYPPKLRFILADLPAMRFTGDS